MAQMVNSLTSFSAYWAENGGFDTPQDLLRTKGVGISNKPCFERITYLKTNFCHIEIVLQLTFCLFEVLR